MTTIASSFRALPAAPFAGRAISWAPVAAADFAVLAGAMLVGVGLGAAVVLHSLSLVVAFQ